MRILSGFLVLILIAGNTIAADSKKDARVTQIIRDVKLMPSDAAARPAIVNDKVREDTGVRTGGDSRSELTFVDLTITRLGANTIFSFNKAGRNAEVDASWRVIDPLEEFWTGQRPETYRAGEWGPKAADDMLAREGRVWRRP